MAAQYGTAKCTGLMSGRTVPKQFYLDDVAAHTATWDIGGGALNGDKQIQFQEPVAITDIVIAAASGQTQTQLVKNGSVIGVLINACHLASVTNRPSLAIDLMPGDRFTLIQVA